MRNWRPFAAEVELVNTLPSGPKRGKRRVFSNPLPTLQFMRHCRVRYRGWRPREEVTVSAETWRLLNEYDVPAITKRIYNVYIETLQTTSNKVQLTLHAESPRKLDLPEEVPRWLLAVGPHGLRLKDIRVGCISQAVTRHEKRPSRGNVGGQACSEKDDCKARCLDECDCVEEFDIDNVVGFYLVNNNAFHLKRLGVETDALISTIPIAGAATWRAVAIGPQESVKRLRIKLEDLHIKRRQIPHITALWLKTPAKGGKCARVVDLRRKFGTGIEPGPHTDDDDSARLVDLAVVGEREEDVDNVFAFI
ncbi:hypothetical protein AAVH_32623, partial [Aphelenchoides avenae]